MPQPGRLAIKTSTCSRFASFWERLPYPSIDGPPLRLQLAKKGHSNEEERQQLLREALKRYELKGKILLADREYIGENWLAFLVKEGIDFVIRLPEGCYKLPIGAAPGAAYSKLCRQAHHRKRGVIKTFTLNGCSLSVVVLKNPQADSEEPLLFFISSLINKRGRPCGQNRRSVSVEVAD